MVPPSQMYAAAENRFHGCHVMWALGDRGGIVLPIRRRGRGV